MGEDEKENPSAKLKKNKINFVPYGTKISLPIMGKAKMVLKCEAGKKVNSTVYVVEGQFES